MMPAPVAVNLLLCFLYLVLRLDVFFVSVCVNKINKKEDLPCDAIGDRIAEFLLILMVCGAVLDVIGEYEVGDGTIYVPFVPVRGGVIDESRFLLPLGIEQDPAVSGMGG
jgi:hypothetical protein